MGGLKEAIQKARERHIDERFLPAKEQETILLSLYVNEKKHTRFVYNLMRQGKPIYEHAQDISMDSIEELRSKYLAKGKIENEKHAIRLLHKLMHYAFNRYCEKRRDAAWAQKFKYGPPLGLKSPTEQWEYDRKRKYYLKNQDHLRTKAKEWRDKNRERLRAKDKENWYKNLEKNREYQREYYRTHYSKMSKTKG